MRVLVCGGRDYADRDQLFDELDKFHAGSPIELLIEGGARGADRLAQEWAKARGVATQRYEADWERFGNTAGPRRNQKMLDEGKPNVCIAFAGGSGTADMVGRAKAARVYTIEVKLMPHDHLNVNIWREIPHPSDPNTIRTICIVCGAFIGDRPK